jgi:parvulin-like peptidyl-prolyl isomerase
MALEPGAWADPIDTPRGWAVVRRDPYFRARVRQLVVGHSASRLPEPPSRSRQAAADRAKEALEKVRADRSRWNAVVEEYGEPPGTRTEGGDIGDVTNAAPDEARLPPEFEAAIAAVPPGTLSDVVETRFGFHVIWRVD